jgi:hypothetical protein
MRNRESAVKRYRKWWQPALIEFENGKLAEQLRAQKVELEEAQQAI